MKNYTIYTTATVNIYVEVEAENEEKALEMVNENICVEEYADDTVGARAYDTEGDGCNIKNISVTTDGGFGWLDWEIE